MPGKVETIKRWCRMLSGKSVFHMSQQAGLYYTKGKIQGYYSDLRHKVTGDILLDDSGVVYNMTNRGDKIYFAITIFQYGLGAYDLYLENGDKEYVAKMMNSVEWALKNQSEDGSWDAFSWQNSDYPYSSMAQAEGASLLCRAYLECKDEKYLTSAVKAIQFMLKPVEEGGVARYGKRSITLEENLQARTILNGMIFSIWGLYDVSLLCDDQQLRDKLSRCVKTLAHILPKYDRKYWSNYDRSGNIASPFYHDLHIEQLKVMYDLFGEQEFVSTYQRWDKYRTSGFKQKKAFLVKAVQKLRKIDETIVITK